jgi:hypothetical protein
MISSGEIENRLVPVMRSRHRASPCYERLSSPDYLADPLHAGPTFRSSLVRFCCGLSGCLPLGRSDHNSSGHQDFYFQASDEWSPSSPLDND